MIIVVVIVVDEFSLVFVILGRVILFFFGWVLVEMDENVESVVRFECVNGSFCVLSY